VFWEKSLLADVAYTVAPAVYKEPTKTTANIVLEWLSSSIVQKRKSSVKDVKH
jgi:hypothetical protein